jgi:small-conductance mechanosensitive channel
MDTSGITTIFSNFFKSFDTPGFLENLMSAVIASLFILIVFNLIRFFTGKAMSGHFAQKTVVMIKRLIRYAGFIIVLLFVFNKMGIDATAILGAAGIAGVAIGFAAQTSFSNIISGFFLLVEKHFQVGDSIEVDGFSGIVRSIDLLSIKIQTFDNRFIRIPNETIIKSNVINVSRFPIRRLDIFITLPYKEDIERVKMIFNDIAKRNIYVLDNPQPLFVLDKFDTNGINFMFGLWFEKENLLYLKNSFFMELKSRFEAEQIELPYKKIEIITSGEKQSVTVKETIDERPGTPK